MALLYASDVGNEEALHDSVAFKSNCLSLESGGAYSKATTCLHACIGSVCEWHGT